MKASSLRALFRQHLHANVLALCMTACMFTNDCVALQVSANAMFAMGSAGHAKVSLIEVMASKLHGIG